MKSLLVFVDQKVQYFYKDSFWTPIVVPVGKKVQAPDGWQQGTIFTTVLSGMSMISEAELKNLTFKIVD